MIYAIPLMAFLSVFLFVLSLVPQSRFILEKKIQIKEKQEIPPWLLDVVGAAVAFLIITLIFGPIYGVIAMPVGLILARKAPGQIAKWQRFFQRKKLLEELEGACLVISSTVRGGLTLLEAYRTAAKHARPPLKRELENIVDQVQYGGKTVGQAVKEFADRWESPELEMLAHASQLASSIGGKDVPKVMQSVSNSIRERKQIDKKIKSKTTYSRISAFVISLVPIFILLVFRYMAPDLYETLMGEAKVFFFVGVCLTIIGWYFVFKIMNIEEF